MQGSKNFSYSVGVAGTRAAGPVDESTFEGRLRSAVAGSRFSAQQIAEACGRASAQTVRDWWTPNKSGSPNPEQLGIISRMTGRSLEWLIYGSEEAAAAESDFIAVMRSLDAELSGQRKRELLRTAEMMLDEDRAREEEDAEAAIRGLVAAGFGEAEARQLLATRRRTDPPSTSVAAGA